ncbi:MAG: undecaprenyl-diphosphate phosphatase [Bifidobacteriaceae bacterium]|jgi:undecaprenyl-diphosphatase|nr:undecaprenyl-diphosphate phosphatase [Bifidobacteriaceae bacterium]
MNFFQAIFLGLVQGLTEFLPISSSAHIRIVSTLMDLGDTGAAFTAITQIGTEAAVILYFRRDIVRLFLGWWRSLIGKKGKDLKSRLGANDFNARMAWYIVVGSLPVVILGLLLKSQIETTFRNLWLTATVLIIFGLFLGIADQIGLKQKTTKDLNILGTLIFGFGQALALIPGVSRSGGSITAGLLAGFDRKTAARYSFLLAIPAVFGSGLFELVDCIKNPPANFPGFASAFIATLVAFVVGYMVIIGFLKLISSHSFRGFVYYRIVIGLLLAVILALGVIPAF